MPRKKTVKTDSQAHGKLEGKAPTTLEEVIYGRARQKYFTTDVNEYSKYVRAIPKSELHQHARQVGVIPSDNRAMLERNLINKFAQHTSGQPRDNKRTSNAPTPEIEALLARGRR